LTITAPDSWPDFHQELLAIRQDPAIKSFALRQAKSTEVAEDALQSAYYAIVRTANPGAIVNLRAYFCRVLLREINRELRQLGAAATEDFTGLTDTQQGRPGVGPPAPRPVVDIVTSRLLGHGWLAALTAPRRAHLTGEVPRRSPDPHRYQEVIVSVAEHVLRITLGDRADPDWNAALTAGYPEWFAEPGCELNTRDQRLKRGRTDIAALLRSIIDRGDLSP
jgi:hypothetical protein